MQRAPGVGLAEVQISGPPRFALADLALWFLRPAKGGDLLARAELLRAGRSRISGTVRLWVDGAPDRPVSQVTGSYVHIQ